MAISVSDQGRGVPPDRLPHLFRKHAGAAAGEGERRLGLDAFPPSRRCSTDPFPWPTWPSGSLARSAAL